MVSTSGAAGLGTAGSFECSAPTPDWAGRVLAAGTGAGLAGSAGTSGKTTPGVDAASTISKPRANQSPAHRRPET
jgi:hypothetical protein